jgi:7,8-dihydropterin-6-yl-methyl-4-(beta-D-ribofuranosyl)aminobenzene 5'-phosphate synthase
MDERCVVSILVDNAVARAGLTVEHGLSMWITVSGKRILFDSGVGDALPVNTAAMGVDLTLTDAVVLSHGHYDHTGGLSHVFNSGATPQIYAHPSIAQARYGCLKTPPHKPIGMRVEVAEALSARTSDIMLTTEPTRVAERVWVTGPIPRRTAFEDTGGSFYIDKACRTQDLIEDDQALWIETLEGVVVVLGCAHSGVVNTLDYIAELTEVEGFRAVIGGMHLLNASEERLAATIEALERFNPKLIAPCHCTGEHPLSVLAERFAGEFVHVGAGETFSWPM